LYLLEPLVLYRHIFRSPTSLWRSLTSLWRSLTSLWQNLLGLALFENIQGSQLSVYFYKIQLLLDLYESGLD